VCSTCALDAQKTMKVAPKSVANVIFESMELGAAPRRGPFADEPGAFDQAIKITTPIVDPGETVQIEQYFVGYGSISAAKMLFYPSNDIFDLSHSRIVNGLTEVEKGRLQFGGQSNALAVDGGVARLGGLKTPTWREETLFFDLEGSDDVGPAPVIATEVRLGRAPFEYALKTRRAIRPGKYSIEFYLVYYDGKAWRTNSKRAEFHVRNVLERHQISIGLLAVVSTVSALWRFVALPLWEWLLKTWP
jgi:hypothetical protein